MSTSDASAYLIILFIDSLNIKNRFLRLLIGSLIVFKLSSALNINSIFFALNKLKARERMRKIIFSNESFSGLIVHTISLMESMICRDDSPIISRACSCFDASCFATSLYTEMLFSVEPISSCKSADILFEYSAIA